MYPVRYAIRPAAICLAAAVALLAALAGPGAAEPVHGRVVKVVDGDTIRVRIDGAVSLVRYIGVNAPEARHPQRGREPGGREATAVNRHLADGRWVRLDFDVRTRDRNGRLLAYVYAGETMINAELVRLGYAQVMTVPPNVKHQRLFLGLEREARTAARGLWGRADATADP